MDVRTRIYDKVLTNHLGSQRQMAMVSGPRQVGKTTTCRQLADVSLNWDNADDRTLVLRGPSFVAERLGLQKLRTSPPTVLFDELHKFHKWKQFLKGFFDTYTGQVRILITGRSSMDVYRRGGDSLMGRYFQDQLNAPQAFQVVVEADFIKADCFTARPQPLVVPARTFLSQLL